MREVELKKYIADDGAEFDTEEACVRHEADIEAGREISEYYKALTTAGYKPTAAKAMTRAVRAFRDWKISGIVSPPIIRPRKAKEEPAINKDSNLG